MLASPNQMARALRSKLLLAFVGSLFAAGLLEGAARLLRLAPSIEPIVLDRPYASFITSPNPRLRYVPKPGSQGISSYGIRDYEYPLEKPDGTFRIGVLGDSVAFGYCTPTESLPIEKTFPKLLEKRLNAPVLPGHQKVEVINLAVSGYDTLQEVEFLRTKGLAFDPDLILVGYCLNDSVESSTELLAFRDHESWGALAVLGARAIESAVLRSHAVRAFWYRLLLLSSSKESETPAASELRSAGFDELRALGYEEGFEVLLAIFPNLYSFEPYQYRADHEDTTRVASARGFEVLDLLPVFNRASQGQVARVRGRCTSVHPNEYGHEVAARALESFIRAHATGAGSPALPGRRG